MHLLSNNGPSRWLKLGHFAGYIAVPAPNFSASQVQLRQSEPASSPTADAPEAADATLSGDLERLSQHLQSARAMYDSNVSRGASENHNRYPETPGYRHHNGYNQGAVLDICKAVQGCTSMWPKLSFMNRHATVAGISILALTSTLCPEESEEKIEARCHGV